MSLSLSTNTQLVIESGFLMLRRYKGSIETEWASISEHLHKRQEKTTEELQAAIHFFTQYLFEVEHENVYELFNDLHEAKNRFNNPLPPNHTMFVITLLENAVHKAIKRNGDDIYQNHQAVQFLFSQISEQILTFPMDNPLNIDTVLQQLASSQQLPIEWIARIHHDSDGFRLKEFIQGWADDLPLQHHFEERALFDLTESLLAALPCAKESERNVYPIPCNEETLLFCTQNLDTSDFIPLMGLSLQMFGQGKQTVEYVKQEQQWKDSVILFNEWVMRSRDFNEAVENITSGFANYLPFERAALFSYSLSDHSINGLHGYQFDNSAVRNFQDKSDNIPLIDQKLNNLKPLEKDLKNLQPIYSSRASEGFPAQYVKQFQLESVVVAPIYVPSEGKLIGAAMLDQGPGYHFKVSRETFAALMKFGQTAGELLARLYRERPKNAPKLPDYHLSAREIEVLTLMAEGDSTSETADHLHLSDYTVRDYISMIMHKMSARNRTEATSRAIRQGII